MGCIFNCEKKTPKPKLPSTKTTHSRDEKLALVVGHNRKSQGATNYLGESEWIFNSRIAKKVQEKLAVKNYDSVILFRKEGVGYTSQVNSIVSQIKIHKCTHAYLMHFNAASGYPVGCEALISETATDVDNKWADKFTDLLNERHGFKERHDDGIKTVRSGHNGHGMINAVNKAGAKSILVEPCFGNWRNKESILIFENEDRYVDVLVDAYMSIVD